MSTPALPAEIGPRDASTALAKGALLLDVREPDEHLAGHVAGSLHIPLGELPARLESIPVDRDVIVACRSGRRSAQATELLRNQQFRVANLQGGLQAWHAAGLELETADGAPGSVA
ncbi:MAG: rhodanese-like domain-containing protein [Acidimicrobiales bacterium]